VSCVGSGVYTAVARLAAVFALAGFAGFAAVAARLVVDRAVVVFFAVVDRVRDVDFFTAIVPFLCSWVRL